MTGFFPFSVLDEMQRDVNRRQAWLNRTEAREWQPAVDVVESESAWLLSMDVPGVVKEAIDITIEERLLTVKTQRTIDYGEQRQAIRERGAGEVSRQFRLPETVDTQNIEARVEHGVLTLALPKQQKVEPRRITVQ